MPPEENTGDRSKEPLIGLRPRVDPRIEARRNNVRVRRRLRAWISIGVAAVLVAIGYGITQSPLLDVDEVEVIGARHTGAATVLEAAGVEPGDPLWRLNLGGPRSSIAALPWVDQVRSSRTWGGKVTFDVTERKAIAQVPVDGETPGDAQWALIDIQGRVLEVNPNRRSLPVVLFGPVPQPGGWLRESAIPLLEASEALIPLRGNGIESIYLESGQVAVDLSGGGQVVWGGRDDPVGKADALARILADVDLNCVESVNISIPELPALTSIDGCS